MDNDFLSRINAQIEELEKRIKSLSMQVTTSAYNATFKLCLDDIKDLIADFKDEFDAYLGAIKPLSYQNYSAMITAFNAMDRDESKVGQNIFVQTLQVPDLWVYSVESSSNAYTYTTDSDFVNALSTDGYVQIGYFKLAVIESNKVDLTNYVTLDGTQDISGVKTFSSGIKIGNGTGTGDILLDSSDRVVIKYGNNEKLKVGSVDTLFANRVTPDTSNTYDLGRSGVYWKDLYLAGNLSDGTNSISIANISKKSTIAEYTLSASNWSNNEYTLSVTGKTSSNNAVVTNSNSGLANSDVLANSNAIAGANIYRIVDNGTSLTFVCENTPTVDIKIQVEVCE